MGILILRTIRISSICRWELCQTSPALAKVHHILLGGRLDRNTNRAREEKEGQPQPSARKLLGTQQLRAVLRGGLTEDFLEDPVEMREGLEANFEGNLADPQVGIEQKVLRFLNAHA
jgi:hypothetical protein